MEDLLSNLGQYNYWNGKRFNLGYTRSFYLSKIKKFIGNKLVKVLVGQRRSGKSYLLRQIIDHLIDRENVNPKNVFYINKEFIGLESIKTGADLQEIFQYYKTKLQPEGKIYIFIDEIQNIEGWETFVNSYSQDFSSDYELFITGSNSQLLSGELATYLSGRYVEFQIFPLGYGEYIDFYKLERSKDTYLQYLRTGGLPELINFSDEEVTRNYIESLKNTIILRDIIQRYGIKDVSLLENLFRFLSNNIGNLTSLPNIIKYFKTIGKKTNYDTLSSYTGSLMHSFVLHEAIRYDIRGKNTLGGVRKYFLNDLAFRNYLLGFTPSMVNTNLENLVYIDLLRHGYKVSVGILNHTEIDFVAQKAPDLLYVQVAYMLSSEKTIQREFGNLQNIDDNYPKYVVTLDDFQYTDVKGIKHFRAWEFDLAEL